MTAEPLLASQLLCSIERLNYLVLAHNNTQRTQFLIMPYGYHKYHYWWFIFENSRCLFTGFLWANRHPFI